MRVSVIKVNLCQENGLVPLNSVLFPISTYLLNVLKKIKIDLSEGSWWFSYEMRQLRLRSNIHALYLYDLNTEEHMILYRKGTVSIADQYSLATTIDNRYQGGSRNNGSLWIFLCRIQVWVL